MKFTYDPQADALCCYWGEPAGVAVSREVADEVILDYGDDGTVIGVEILGAKERLEILGPHIGTDGEIVPRVEEGLLPSMGDLEVSQAA